MSEENQVQQEQAPAQNQPQPGQIQVNVDYLRTTKVHFVTPCYGGMMTESTFMSYIKWANAARQLGIDWTLETMTNESLIPRARNTLAAKFLAQTDATHQMSIDADIGFEPWHIMVMLCRDVDVIGGLYPMKSIPVKWCVNGFEGAEEGPDGLQEVSKTGTGFLLAKRHVFEKLKSHPAVRQFNNDIGLPAELNEHMYTFFDTPVREGRFYSEDWAFCEYWRDIGGKVWVDKRVLLRHSGTYVFDYQAQQEVYKNLHMIYANENSAKEATQVPAQAPVVADSSERPAPPPAVEAKPKRKSKKKEA